jgi:type VI secretion system secreted protein Hcp
MAKQKTAAAHSDCFLEIDGIPGESTDADHQGAIEIQAYQFGAATRSNVGTSAGGDGQEVFASVKDLLITAYSSSASPLLFQAALQGKLFADHQKGDPPVKITCRKAGDKQQEYLTIELQDVLISNFQHGNSHDPNDAPLDHFSLNFGVIQFTVHPQKEDGSLGAPVKVAYDLGQLDSNP